MRIAALLALVTALGGGLEYGPHSVGYQRMDGSPAISIWYPTAARVDAPGMTLRAYGGELPPGLPAGVVSRYLDSPAKAVRDARPSSRNFPLVLVAHGNAHDAADQAILAEYLASHGFVVAATPSPMVATPMTSADEIAIFAERQADDLAAAMDTVQKRGLAATDNVVVIGHSFGARSALLLAMRDRRIAGLLSLDGGIGTATGVDLLRAAPSFDAKRTPAILHIYSDVDAFMKSDFAFLDSLDAPFLEKELVTGLRHAQFSSVGFGAAAIPELAQIMKSSPDLREKVNGVAKKTLLFVRRHTGR